MKKLYCTLLSMALFAGMASAQITGTYTVNLQATDIYGATSGQPVAVQVQVTAEGNGYVLSEANGDTYFHGLTVPFTYNDATKMAIIAQTYVATSGSDYLWAAAFNYNGSFIEPQPQYAFSITENSIIFGEEDGIAWYISESASDLYPSDVKYAYYVTSDSGSGSGESYANPAIEGTWKVFYDYAYGVGETDDPFNVTINGNYVTFEGEYDTFIGEFTAPNTIKFNKMLVGDETAESPLYQVPFISTEAVDEIWNPEEQDCFVEFTATFDEENGTLTFPENSGIAFAAFNKATGAYGYYLEGWKFISAEKLDVIYADSAVEGNWNFTTNWIYDGEYSLGKQIDAYEATLDGNIITFSNTLGESFVGVFTAENEVTFSEMLLDEYTTQIPFVNTTGTTDYEQLTPKAFTATYRSFDNSLIFPEGAGLMIGYVNADGEMPFGPTLAFDLESAVMGEPVYGNPSIEGEWTLTLNGKFEGLGEFNEVFTATLDGNTVTFSASQSQYNIVAEFVDKNHLMFKSAAVLTGTEIDGEYVPAQNALWQYPYTNGDEAETIAELNDEVFYATYMNGSIYIPVGSGLKYRYVNVATGEPAQEWMDAFNFVAFNKGASYADASIEGEWTFTLDGAFQGAESLGEFNEVFTATLQGSVVTFTASQSNYNIVAEFTDKGILTFSSAAVLTGTEIDGEYVPSQNALWQYPYTNGNDAETIAELNDQSFTASYRDGAISFPVGSGLKYRYVNVATGEPAQDWMDAFNFVAANKGTSYADMSIEGDWYITENGAYAGDSNLGEFETLYTAKVQGEKVIFTSSDSPFNIVAEFTAANTLTFSAALVGNTEIEIDGETIPVQNVLWQYPYTNGRSVTEIDALNDEVFTATYNAYNGTIEFPEGAGLKYRYVNVETGEPAQFWLDAYDLIEASRTYIEPEHPETGSVEGLMTAQVGDNIQTSSWNVTANVTSSTITIYNFAGFESIQLSYQPETGGVSSATDVVATTIDGVDYYFTDVNANEAVIYGVIYNSDETHVTIMLNTWGIAPADGSVALDNTYYDTVITLDTTIEGIPNENPSAIGSLNGDANGEVIYFDLSGRKVNNPQGGIFIRVQNGKATKISVK